MNAYLLQSHIYTGNPKDGPRQKNFGEKTVVDLVESYKGTGRNVVTENFFFASLDIAKKLNSGI